MNSSTIQAKLQEHGLFALFKMTLSGPIAIVNFLTNNGEKKHVGGLVPIDDESDKAFAVALIERVKVERGG